jgi:hypothetical protein
MPRAYRDGDNPRNPTEIVGAEIWRKPWRSDESVSRPHRLERYFGGRERNYRGQRIDRAKRISVRS